MTIPVNLDVLTYCLEQEFPATLTAALLDLAACDSTEKLQAAWEAWRVRQGGAHRRATTAEFSKFAEAVEEVLGVTCTVCDGCSNVGWEDGLTETVDEQYVCDRCLSRHYRECDGCGGWALSTTEIYGGDRYCQNCIGDLNYCDECDLYYRNSDGEDHDHDESCNCDPPVRRFEFPNDGAGTVRQNERLTVELPQGTIDDEGLRKINQLVMANLTQDRWLAIGEAINEVGPLWQAKRGNFTRRLSTALHRRGVKLPEGIISEVGNLARQHSSTAASWHIEFTRDLNDTALSFYNAGSCWWGSHSISRCCFKNWGGIGIRSYSYVDTDRHMPQGRAWVQPLNEELRPTHDALNAHAFVVYNGYGQLQGYVAARIVAHLTSRTYRKVSLAASDEQYVNGDAGYLIADEATCQDNDSITYSSDPHNTLDARQVLSQKAAVA